MVVENEDRVTSDLPIGVFDSGVGGLTVLRALRRRLPAESLIYLGDTARVPYGTKSVASIVRYAAQATDHLVSRNVKMLVVACAYACRRQHHLVLATESTVRRHAYAQAIARLTPGARVDEQACSLFVALAEEGWTDGEVPDAVARTYLAPRMTHDDGGPDTIVLGCTHFPLLHDAIRSAVGPDVAIVDSATTTAEAVARVLAADGLLTTHGGSGTLTLLATDGPDRFATVGARFLGEPIGAADVEVVDL